MKPLAVLALPVFLGLATLGASAGNNVPQAEAVQKPVATFSQIAQDMDIVGVVGDVMVDGCKADDARCSKAWKDLADLAGKDSL